jgi:hypothetical protein
MIRRPLATETAQAGVTTEAADDDADEEDS